MTAQVLDRIITTYRIGDPAGAFPIFDAKGAELHPGRWNTAASPVIYSCGDYSTAMLEKLVHGGGRLPPNQHFIEITMPPGLSYEMVEVTRLPGWDARVTTIPQQFGERWFTEKRSLLLVVPSVVARMAYNWIINPNVAGFARITTSLHRPVWWDDRLFAK